MEDIVAQAMLSELQQQIMVLSYRSAQAVAELAKAQAYIKELETPKVPDEPNP